MNSLLWGVSGKVLKARKNSVKRRRGKSQFQGSKWSLSSDPNMEVFQASLRDHKLTGPVMHGNVSERTICSSLTIHSSSEPCNIMFCFTGAKGSGSSMKNDSKHRRIAIKINMKLLLPCNNSRSATMACGKVQINSWTHKSKDDAQNQSRLFCLFMTESNINPFKQKGELVGSFNQTTHAHTNTFTCTPWEESQQ